jgi:hypothetical protein
MSKAAKRVHRLQLCRGPQDGGREHRLVALEVARLDQPQVRWHDVADVQDDNVTRDEVGDVDVGRSAVGARCAPADLRVQGSDVPDSNREGSSRG